jgi:twitching motility two-component system response regulator PilH
VARILIVEDSPTQLFTLRKILSRHGHEILSATDGTQGVEVAKKELPDLILMDVVMPRLNGFQATRILSKNASTRHIPVILVTTKDQETDKIWGQRQGAKSYITKPVEEAILIDTINELLAKLA